MSDDARVSKDEVGERPFDDDRAKRDDLLRAAATIVEPLDPEVVLRRIVEAGIELVGARFGALGVLGPDGGLERFIHVGIDPQTVDRIARRPEDHARTDGFLSVPVRVGEQVYGNLYLANGVDGPFTSEDEELVLALASTAGIAIENASLYNEARTRGQWNAAIADVMAAMLDTTGDDVLDLIADRVAHLIDADLVCIITPADEGKFVVSTAYGRASAPLRGRVYRGEGSLAEQALTTREAVSVDAQTATANFARSGWRHDLGPTLTIPLFAGEEPLGVLSVSRGPGGIAFTPADVEMAFAFAAETSSALEAVREREDRRRLDTSRDRSRIARDLHDNVIQRLFGAGLALQAVSATVAPAAAAAIDHEIDAIDAAIKDIRTAIFAARSDSRAGVKRLRDRLLDVVSDIANSSLAPPRVSFAGPFDSLVSPGLADDVVAALRELLTNAVKHANADAVDVSVVFAENGITLTVQDDGDGIADSSRRSGLANLTDRALLRGGSCDVSTAPDFGTRVTWWAPAGEER